MSIKKNIFAPLTTGLGAMRRAATALLLMLLTTATAWAQDVTYLDENGTDLHHDDRRLVLAHGGLVCGE